MRKCESLGIVAIEPGPGCPWATEVCRKTCYFQKSLRRFGMRTYGKAFEVDAREWNQLGELKGLVGRIRLATRWEPIKDASDIERIRALCRNNPHAVVWCPTRAWRNPELLQELRELRKIRNLRLLCSFDESNTREEFQAITEQGFSTMANFGWGEHQVHPWSESEVRCCKTFDGKQGACATCKKGCFSASRVDVLLKRHS